MNSATWRKSSYSKPNGGECVEVGAHHGRVLMRDTKDREGLVLRVSPAVWRRFADHVKSGRPLAADPRGVSRHWVRGALLSGGATCAFLDLFPAAWRRSDMRDRPFSNDPTTLWVGGVE